MSEFQRRIELEEFEVYGDLDELKKAAEATRIKFHESNAQPALPIRPYEIDIETGSGSITGRYIFSTAASLRTKSGSISTQLVPIVSLDSDGPWSSAANFSLTTSTDTGSTQLRLTEPYFVSAGEGSNGKNKRSQPETPRDFSYSTDVSVTSSHTATGSGSLLIGYPQSWAGHVLAASSGRGSVLMGGEGLKFSNSGPQQVTGVKEPEPESENRRWWGSEGAMNVSVKGEGSGSIQIWVGR